MMVTVDLPSIALVANWWLMKFASLLGNVQKIGCSPEKRVYLT